MSTGAWIFLLGLRVFDLAALVAWLVWFLRLRDEPDDRDDSGPGGGGPERDGPQPGPVGPTLGLPLPNADAWGVRLRDHDRPGSRRRTRRPAPVRPERRRAPSPQR